MILHPRPMELPVRYPCPSLVGGCVVRCGAAGDEIGGHVGVSEARSVGRR